MAEFSPILGADGSPYPSSAGSELKSYRDHFLLGAPQSRYDTRIKTPWEGLGNPAVWRCLSFLADKMRSVPFLTRRNLPEGGSVVDRNHQAYRLLRRQAIPRWVSAGQWKATSSWGAAYFGNHISGIERDQNNRPTMLVPFGPDHAKVDVDIETGQISYAIFYRRNNDRNAKWHNVDPRDVFHVKGFLSADGLRGLPFWEYASEVIGIGNLVRDYAGGVHSRGASPTGVISFPLSLPADSRMDYAKTFADKIVGFGRQGSILFRESDQEFTPVQSTARDAQMKEGRQLSDNEVAMLFGFPSSTVNNTESESYGSREQQSQDETDALDPWMVRYEEEAWEKLLTGREQDTESHKAEFKREALLRLDHKTMIESMILEIQWGLLLVNEARTERNRAVYQGVGNEPIAPTNYGTLRGIETNGANAGQAASQRDALQRARIKIGKQLERRLSAADSRQAVDSWLADEDRRKANRNQISASFRRCGIPKNRARKSANDLIAITYDSVNSCLRRNDAEESFKPALGRLAKLLTRSERNGR